MVQWPQPLLGKRILIVDDDDAAREAVGTLLDRAGAAVVSVDSGAAALEELDRATPDAMVVDIGMPVLNGFRLVEGIRTRSEAEGGNVPVTALTGYVSWTDRAQAFRSGFDAYLIKPVEPAQLIHTLEDLCASHTHTEAGEPREPGEPTDPEPDR